MRISPPLPLVVWSQNQPPQLVSLNAHDAVHKIRQFVTSELSNRNLLMSLLSLTRTHDTVMITSSAVSVQEVVDALENGSTAQPKVS